MSTHPQSGPLAHLGLLRVAGADTIAFLQGQISQDARRLEAGRPLLAAYSSSQGRVLAILHLLPHSSGIIAVLPRELLAPTIERLRKYVLRAKVRIEAADPQLAVAGFHGADALAAAGVAAPGAAQAYLESNGVGVGRVGAQAGRYWVIGPPERLAALGRAARAAEVAGAARSERDWRLADIRAGMPQVYAATSELFVAQMLNLDLLDGISFSKGCFTGQEIIARTQHLGRIKRRMMRLALHGRAFAVGETLRLADGRSGRITEVARGDDGCEALAVLPIDAGAPAEADPGNAPVCTDAALLPLPYPLAPPG